MPGMTLYEVDSLYENALAEGRSYAEEHDGELPDGFSARIDGLQAARDHKLANLGRHAKNIRAEYKAVKAEKERLAKRERSLERELEWVKEYLEAVMKTGEHYKDAAVSLYWHSNQGVDIVDQPALPLEYIKHAESIDKENILKDLRLGNVIPGAELTTRYSIVIR